MIRACTLLFLLAAALLAGPARAHPGWGIVEDSRGNIYYTDLAQVWWLAPDGTRTVAVPHVHTHELYLDGADNLYGEHVWYEGEASDKWGWRVWRLPPGGRPENVIPATEGFRRDYSFVRDAAGNMYWADQGPGASVHKRTPAGQVTKLGETRLGDVRSMTVTPSGIVHLIDGEDLVTVDPAGEARRVAGLAEETVTQPFVNAHHRVMGLWTDPAGNVYAAIWGAQKVKRIDPAGRVSVVARSTFPWSPTGGMVARDGRMWLLETSVTNAVRVRRADLPEPGRHQVWLWLGAALLLLAISFILIRAHRRRRR
jgi:hypothetical protein